MKTRLILLLIILSFNSSVFSQDEAFKVLAVKGANQLFRTSKWIPLAPGIKIYNTDKIKLPDGGYVGLVTPNGKTTELKTVGIYNVNDLSLKLKQTNSTFVKKYANSLAKDFSNSNVVGDHRDNMSVTGSVERGNVLLPVVLFMPSMTKLIDDEINIVWLKNNAAEKNYVLTIKKIFADTIFSQVYSDTMATLKTSDLKLERNQVYAISVGIKGVEKSKSNPLILKFPSTNETDTLKKEKSEILSEMDENNAMDQLILASFYEKNQLYTSAISAYQKAILLQPGVDYYKLVYQDFIERNKMGSKQ